MALSEAKHLRGVRNNAGVEYYVLTRNGGFMLSGKYSGHLGIEAAIKCRNHPQVMAEYIDIDNPANGPGTLCSRCKYGRGDL